MVWRPDSSPAPAVGVHPPPRRARGPAGLMAEEAEEDTVE